MIYFVTNKNEHYKKSISVDLFPDITVLNEKTGKNLYYKIFKKHKILAIDTETNGLDPFVNTILLFGIGNKHNQFMFDASCDISDIVEHFIEQKKIALGHNFKFDIKMIGVQTNHIITRVYDTMIAEQRLYMKAGLSFGYDAVVERYTKKVLTKGVRLEFVGKNPETFQIQPHHLYYLKADLYYIFDVRKAQRKLIKLFKVPFLIYGVEFPLISIVAIAELEGVDLDVDKWKSALEKKKTELFNTQIALDEEVLKLKQIKIEEGVKDVVVLLGGNKYNKPRVHSPLENFIKPDGTVAQEDLFGNPMTIQSFAKKKTLKIETLKVNYKSKKDVVFIFGALKEPMITPEEKFSIPIIKDGKLLESVHKYTIKEEFLQRYIIMKPESIMIPFIELVMKQSKLEKSISTYGLSFLDKINPVTGKIHTIFRQCQADTGRFQSGGGDLESDKINIQNIPRELDYREAFTTDTENYSILTADYSGAELVVMASHAQDFKLIELSAGDMHSHMATICWRNIFRYREGSILNMFNSNPRSQTAAFERQVLDYRYKKEHFLVDKSMKERTNFKPMTFEIQTLHTVMYV